MATLNVYFDKEQVVGVEKSPNHVGSISDDFEWLEIQGDDVKLNTLYTILSDIYKNKERYEILKNS